MDNIGLNILGIIILILLFIAFSLIIAVFGDVLGLWYIPDLHEPQCVYHLEGT